MALISVANLQSISDKLAACWIQALAAIGHNVSSPAAGTVQGSANSLLAAAVALNDFEQEADLNAGSSQFLKAMDAAQMMGPALNMIGSINQHLAARGYRVSTSIVDLASFLSYYNGGSGGSLFSSMLVPEFLALYKAVGGATALPVAGIMSPALQTEWNSALTNGMGKVTYSGTYTAGSAVDTSQYSEVTLVAEVRTTFASGSSAPQISVAGTDHTGATSTTWTGTFSGNNPAAALSGITVTPSVSVAARQTVALSSTTGIVVGSVLTINKNKPDQEVIVVEAVAGGNITAVFRLAHSSGATVDGWTSIALSPSVGGRRCRSVSGMTPTINGHNAGLIQLNGVQDRVGV